MLRKILVSILGFTLLIAGFFLTILPGPGLLFIIAGLAVLSSQYDWAKHYVEKAKSYRPKRKPKPDL